MLVTTVILAAIGAVASTVNMFRIQGVRVELTHRMDELLKLTAASSEAKGGADERRDFPKGRQEP